MKRFIHGVMLTLFFSVNAFALEPVKAGAFAAEAPVNHEGPPAWQFKLSGDERFRVEYKKDFDFNESKKDNGSQFYHRLRLGLGAGLTDEQRNPELDIFVEGLDAQTGGHHIKANAGQTDDFDLHQAFVNVYNILGSDIGIKAGRQELNYGEGRLVAAPAWSNRMRHFDAGVIRYRHSGFYADALYGQDVKYDDDKFNRSRNEEILGGLYAGYQRDKTAPLIETYFFSLIDIKGTNDIHRHTIGAHLKRSIAAGAVIDIEIPYQFGKTGTTTAGTKDIEAYALHIDVSKSWSKTKWKPKFSFSYDEASGDRDPNDSANNTFVPLYQSTHGPYGQLDFFRWQNVRNPELSLTLSPTEKFRFTPQLDFFWLQSKSDSWYNSSGAAFRTQTGGDRNYYAGSEASLRFNYDFTKNLKFETGCAHFFTGGYTKDTGADDDSDWVYSQVNIKY